MDKSINIQETCQVLAKCHSELDNTEEAMALLPDLQSDKIQLKSISGEQSALDTILNKGKLYHEKREFSKSLEQYKLYLRIVQGNSHTQCGEVMYELGRVFFDMGDYTRSFFSYQRALQIFEEDKSPLICDTLLSMVRIIILVNFTLLL